MKTNYLQLVNEHKAEIPVILETGWVPREVERLIQKESSLIQVITGVRRSGKSTLVHRALSGLPYAYVNFDDERLAGIPASGLNEIVEAMYAVYGEFTHVFFDEIQNVDHWPLFINRLQRNRLHVFLTGSNSRLLSREAATHLTGRYHAIELLPFSFLEFIRAHKLNPNVSITAKSRGTMLNLLLEYFQTGGMPEIVTTHENAIRYASDLLESILTRDILFRYSIRQPRSFREIARYLISLYGQEISYNRIKNTFQVGSENTVKTYTGYLEEAWVSLTLPKFSYKNQESLRYRKIYAIDPILTRIVSLQSSPDRGKLLENLVFLELKRQSHLAGFDLFYYKKTIEVDFVVYKDRQVQLLIQVCDSLAPAKTRKREVNSLISASKELNVNNLLIVTTGQTEIINESGTTIYVVNFAEWAMRQGERKEAKERL